MRSKIHYLCFLVLLCASDGWTHIDVDNSSTAAAKNCTQREGTSFTVIMDAAFIYWRYQFEYKSVLDRLSSRFPCVTRKYISVILDDSATIETITADKDEFMKSVRAADGNYSYYVERIKACNQSLLHGLKKALQLSPAESVIFVLTFGSMVDSNDAQLLSDVNALLKEKKSQVYFLLYPLYCPVNPSQHQIFKEISSLSYGELLFFLDNNYYQLGRSLELLLSKPLNQTHRILTRDKNLKASEVYTDKFDVTTALTHLLIISDYRSTLNLTDPKGNVSAFNTFSRNLTYYDNCKDLEIDFAPCSELHVIRSHLVKNPTTGTWTLSAVGNGSFSVQIFGFTELGQSGNCSNPKCHPNATCEEFGGYGECTCKDGFAGDGITCDDTDECLDYYSNVCSVYSSDVCVNTIGSYTCDCYSKTTYAEQFGCIDINECADKSLNDCHPQAVCSNYYGSYSCHCSDGYYGDGKYCEVDECKKESTCKFGEECIKYNGSYSCTDPCSNHTVLNAPWRTTANTDSYQYHCDNGLQGWYRFKGTYDQKIPERCITPYSCGTEYPMWMNGSHPTASDGIVKHTACASWDGNCCIWSTDISVKMCPGGFYVYKLQGTPACNLAYCTESNSSCSGTLCASDEVCIKDGGDSVCQCNDSSTLNGSKPLTDYPELQVTCGLENIRVTFSKCLLEKLGYNTSSISLKNNSCKGVIERRNKSYIVLMTRPQNGYCGAEMWYEGNDIKYENTVYLGGKSNGGITGEEKHINFYCAYPLNMEINLLSALNPLTVNVSISVNRTVNYTVTMGLFQDSDYTIPFNGSEASINSATILYVGVFASGSNISSPFVLIMKNCYATPTADANGNNYDIIRDQCPSRNDSTVSVLENGASLRGRFSVQIFSFVSSSQVNLYCQVGLCDSSKAKCSAQCPSSAPSPDSNSTAMQNITIGPIKNTDAVASGGGPTVPAAKLFLGAIVFLMLLCQHDY